MTGAVGTAALQYALQHGWPVFPCHWQGERRKRPLIEGGFRAASRDPRTIIAWWTEAPRALVGVPTGEVIGCAVLDIDRKNGIDGMRTFAELDGCPIPPPTPTVTTPSGGIHFYFARPDGGLRNTNGERGRGVGPGLDWRGDGGYVIVPAPGSGYAWDRWTFENTTPKPVPPALLPREPERSVPPRPVRPATGLSPYGRAALDNACRRIATAPAGEQEMTLNAESYAIGTLAGAGLLPADFAFRSLIYAARQIRDHDPRRPWRAAEIDRKVQRSFGDGLAHPRGRDA